MKKLFLLFFVVFSINSFAQNDWPVIGTKWYYSYRENPFASAANGYVKLEIVKDTTIDSQSCRILEKTLFTTDNKITHLQKEYIYSDNNKLYIFQKDNFHLLYDYSLEVTDTFQIKLYDPSQSIDTIMNIVVDSVSLIKAGDSFLKKFHYRPVEKSIQGWRFSGDVIEKIGNLNYFLPYNELDCDAGSCAGPLRCYQDGIITYTQGGFDCEELYTKISELQNNHYSTEIYPNPTGDYLNLKLKDSNLTDIKVRIFNNFGQLISDDNYIVDNNTIIINVRNLTNNIYFIQIISNDKIISKQFIKSY